MLGFATDDQVSWRAVQLAGQGIALYAYANRENTPERASLSGLEHLSALAAQEELIEELKTAWRSYQDGQLSAEDATARLEAFVHGFLEHYPRGLDGEQPSAAVTREA